MSLVALRDAIVTTIEKEIVSFETVQPHGGRFTLEELRRWAHKAPACLVVVLGGPLEREMPQAVGQIEIAAFVVTQGSSVIPRDTSGLILSEAIAGLVINNEWDYEHSKAPERASINNLYQSALDKHGVSLWAVRWSQQTDLAIFDPGSLEDFHQVNVSYDLVPADGVPNTQQTIYPWTELMSAYGNINIETAIATSIATPDTYQKAAGTTELNLSARMDMPVTGRLRHTGGTSKPFLISASASVTVSANTKVTLAIAKGGVVDTDTEIEQEVTLAGGAKVFSLKHIMSLTVNEYVEVWVKADDAVDVTLTKLNLIAAAT